MYIEFTDYLLSLLDSEDKSILSKNEKEVIDRLADKIIESEDPEKIIDFVKNVKDVPAEKLTYAICKFGTIDNIYWFARNAKGVSIDLIQNAILSKGKAKYIYDFARYVKGIDIELFADTICETKNAEYIYLFARDVDHAPIKKLSDTICETKNAEYIYKFVRDIKYAPINQLIDALFETKNARYMYLATYNIFCAPVEKLVKAICQSGDVDYICEIAKDENCRNYVSFNELVDIVCKSDDAEGIYNFADEVKGAPIKKLAEAVCRIGDAAVIYDFAENIEDAPIDILEEAICKTKDAYYICEFATEIDESNCYKLGRVLCEIGDEVYINKFIEQRNIDEEFTKLSTEAICKSDRTKYIYKFTKMINKNYADFDKLGNAIVRANNSKHKDDAYFRDYLMMFISDYKFTLTDDTIIWICENKSEAELYHIIKLFKEDKNIIERILSTLKSTNEDKYNVITFCMKISKD